MIINVRGCSNKFGIIVSYLVENEEKTGYDSFDAKKIIVKNKIDMLAAIKKTLISSRKLSEINASDFISTINKVGRKNIFDTSLKTIVKSINDESMQSTMATLSHVYFNNKPLPQIKAINIINGNMYFMVKVGPSYNLEPIKSERIKCVIVINSLVNLYRRIKQRKTLPKGTFKKHYISRPRPRSPENTENVYHAYREGVISSISNSDENNPTERVLGEPVSPSIVTVEETVPPANNNNWYGPTLYTYSEGTSTRRQAENLTNINIPTSERRRSDQREQIGRIVESLYGENTETPQPEITQPEIPQPEIPQPETTDTIEEERPIEEPTERQAAINGDIFTIEEIGREGCLIEPPQLEITNTTEEEGREERERERRDNLRVSIAEVAVSVAEAMVVDENEEEEDRPTEIDSAEREAEEERREVAEEERRTNLEIAVSQSSAERDTEEERLTNTVEPSRIDEADEEAPSTRQAVTASMRQAVSRQTEEERRMSTGNRCSLVDYLRDNQTITFNAFRGNNNTDTSN
jgi:hypothetical protein